MTDNIDKDEIRRAIDRLQIEHPCNIAYDPIAFANMEAVNTIQRCIDQIAKRMAEDTEINIICEMAKLYLEGVKPTTERPHGEWIESKERTEHFYCSECVQQGKYGNWRELFDFKYNFCPNCGSRMNGGDEE